MTTRNRFLYAFADAQLAADEGAGAPTMTDIFTAFGIKQPGEGTPAPDPAQGDQGSGTPEDEEAKKKKAEEEAAAAAAAAAADGATPPAEGGTEPPKEDPKPPAPAPDPKANQTAETFARMRVQNRQYQDMLTQIAGVLGVQDTSDPAKMVEALQQMVLKAQAKNTGIPEDFLQRQKATEERLAQFESEQLKGQALLGFQKVKDTYQLSNEEVSNFADKLLEKGRNPFASPMDLIEEYRLLFFDQIIEKEKQKALAAEAERAAKAASHSTQPPKKEGAGGGSQAKIETIRELDNWLSKQP